MNTLVSDILQVNILYSLTPFLPSISPFIYLLSLPFITHSILPFTLTSSGPPPSLLPCSSFSRSSPLLLRFLPLLLIQDLFYNGENHSLEQPQSLTCPLCGQLGFSESQLREHVTKQHSDSTTLQEVICPVCAAHPSGDPNHLTDDLPTHLTVEHRALREMELMISKITIVYCKSTKGCYGILKGPQCLYTIVQP